jgi:GT2 family glycosyltransferase
MQHSPGPVALVVVTWNSAPLLPGLIESLAAGMSGLRWQLVVSDNDSHDDTVAEVRRLAPEALVVQTGRNAGYAAAINHAVAAIDKQTSDIRTVLICNPDIRMRPGCGAALVAALATPGTGITAPVLYDGNGVMARSLRREPSISRALGEAVLGNRRSGRFARLGELVTDPAAYRGPTRADWAAGALLAISVACLAACGPWDEGFFLYSEETEFALRARDRGFATTLAPDAVATHLEGDSKVSPRLWTLLTLNRVRLYRRRHGPAATAAFWGAVLLREVSRAAIGKPQSRAAALALLSPSRLRAVPGP